VVVQSGSFVNSKQGLGTCRLPPEGTSELNKRNAFVNAPSRRMGTELGSFRTMHPGQETDQGI
jgi:hypothetical protein